MMICAEHSNMIEVEYCFSAISTAYNKQLPYRVKKLFTVSLTYFISKMLENRENHFKKSNAKKNINIREKTTFLNSFTPFIQKLVNVRKNAWSYFCCIFHMVSFEKKTPK